MEIENITPVFSNYIGKNSNRVVFIGLKMSDLIRHDLYRYHPCRRRPPPPL